MPTFINNISERVDLLVLFMTKDSPLMIGYTAFSDTEKSASAKGSDNPTEQLEPAIRYLRETGLLSE